MHVWVLYQAHTLVMFVYVWSVRRGGGGGFTWSTPGANLCTPSIDTDCSDFFLAAGGPARVQVHDEDDGRYILLPPCPHCPMHYQKENKVPSTHICWSAPDYISKVFGIRGVTSSIGTPFLDWSEQALHGIIIETAQAIVEELLCEYIKVRTKKKVKIRNK